MYACASSVYQAVLSSPMWPGYETIVSAVTVACFLAEDNHGLLGYVGFVLYILA